VGGGGGVLAGGGTAASMGALLSATTGPLLLLCMCRSVGITQRAVRATTAGDATRVMPRRWRSEEAESRRRSYWRASRHQCSPNRYR
jgi:hypothetical protein